MEHNQVIDEINYYKAQVITELLYARGMITFDEYDKLTDMNRQTFSPIYAEINRSEPADILSDVRGLITEIA